ncbi:MAG: Gfo/Idh/MocA family protein [Methylococcus sp.]
MTDQTKLRWGILGAARVNERLLPAIVEARNAELVAIASRRPGAAAATLARYAPDQTGVMAYDSLEPLLADERIQAVYLPMANEEHAEWALRAIARGKHLLIEKPMALAVADIEAIEAAARERGVTVMEGFMYRFHPQHERVRELLASGLIGDIRFVRTSFSFQMRPARLYRLGRNISMGGGAMWDIGCYAIHTARMWFAEAPLAVTSMAHTVESGADVSTSGIIDFGNGRRAHFDFSFECTRRSEYEITGTLGSLKCPTVWQLPGDVPEIQWWTEDGRRGEERLKPANHFVLEIEGFSDAVLSGQPPLLSFEDAKANCRVIVAALESAATGQTVRIG